jgi:hypothetical protein
MNPALPRRLAGYVHDTGIRALDHLAETVAPPEEGGEADALQTLVRQWRGMTEEQKDDFVGHVAGAVGEVIAASTLLPVGIEVGKRAVKSAKKVLKRGAKTLKRTAKAAAAGDGDKKRDGKKKRKRK